MKNFINNSLKKLHAKFLVYLFKNFFYTIIERKKKSNEINKQMTEKMLTFSFLDACVHLSNSNAEMKSFENHSM